VIESVRSGNAYRRRGSATTPVLLVVLAVLVLAAAVAVLSLRPTEKHRATGTIITMDFVPAHTTNYRVGRRGHGTAHYNAEYQFQVDVDGFSEPMRGTIPGSTTPFEVGDQVSVVFHQAGLWPFWRYNKVLDMAQTT